MVHRVAPRTLSRAYPSLDLSILTEGGDDQDADFHRRVRSKLKRSVLYMTNVPQMRFAACASVTAEPLDRLLMVVQRESEGGEFLLKILKPSTCPITSCQRQYKHMLTSPLADTMAPMLCRFFGGSDDDAKVEIRRLLCGLSLQMTGEVWLRCDRQLKRFPFRLALLADPDASRECKESTAQSLLSMPDCCLDAGFSRKALWVGWPGSGPRALKRFWASLRKRAPVLKESVII